MKEVRPLTRRHLVLVLSMAAGALGLLPLAGEAMDPLVCLGWLALLAPAAGFACGAAGFAPWPYGMAVPGVWASLLFSADVRSERDLIQPFWGMVAIGGLFTLGSALGSFFPRRAVAGTGLCILLSLVASAAPLQGGLSEAPPVGRDYPTLARFLIDSSPLVFALESAGHDWTHAHPGAYRRSGVEWFPRRPWEGPLGALPSLLVGCVLAQIFGRRRSRLAGVAADLE